MQIGRTLSPTELMQLAVNAEFDKPGTVIQELTALMPADAQARGSYDAAAFVKAAQRTREPGARRLVQVVLSAMMSSGDLSAATALEELNAPDPAQKPVQRPAPGPSRFDAEYREMLAACSKTGPAVASAVEDLRDTDLSWKRRLELIDAAQHTISFSYYAIGADTYGHAFLDRLLAAAKRGVAVAGSLSWATNEIANRIVLCKTQEQKDSYKLMQEKLAELEAYGGFISYEMTLTHLADNFGGGNHYKALCIDGDKCIVGGRNVVDFEFSPKIGMRDEEMLLSGPIATNICRETQRIIGHGKLERRSHSSDDEFARHRQFALTRAALAQRTDAVAAQHRAEPPDGPVFYPIVWDPTYDAGTVEPERNRNTIAMLRTIERAQRELVITCNYWNDSGEITEAVVAAARRGVKVKIVTTSEKDSGVSPWPYMAASRRYLPLVEAGIEIYETTVPEHGKMLIADGEVAAFGSFNVEIPAEDHLTEGMFYTLDLAIIKAIYTAAMQSVNDGTLVTLEKAKQLVERKWGIWNRVMSEMLRPYI